MPLKDINIFFVLKDSEKHYRSKAPSVVIGAFYVALVEKYGTAAVRQQSRSVNVDFGVVSDAEDNTTYRVVRVDVVQIGTESWWVGGCPYVSNPDVLVCTEKTQTTNRW